MLENFKPSFTSLLYVYKKILFVNEIVKITLYLVNNLIVFLIFRLALQQKIQKANLSKAAL